MTGETDAGMSSPKISPKMGAYTTSPRTCFSNPGSWWTWKKSCDKNLNALGNKVIFRTKGISKEFDKCVACIAMDI